MWILVVALAGGDWQCKENDAGLWECHAPPPVAVAPEPPPAALPADDPAPFDEPASADEPAPAEETAPIPTLPEEDAAPAATVVPDPYIVQIGAFRNREAAERLAAQTDRKGLSIVPTRRGDEDWYVLLLGAFPSWEAADTAGRDYEREFSRSYWVRRASDLQRVLREGGS